MGLGVARLETYQTHHNRQALLDFLRDAKLLALGGVDIDGVRAELCTEPAEVAHDGRSGRLLVAAAVDLLGGDKE